MTPSGPDILPETSIGAYLRKVREAQGKSLDDAAKVTRIGKNYLIAIEEETYDRLPNPAYVKGFLRIYATYLNLSGDDLISRYEATSPGKTGGTPPAADGDEQRERGRWWVVPLILLILLLVTATIMRKGEHQEQRSMPAPTVAKLPPPAPVQRPLSSATPAKPAPPTAGAPIDSSVKVAEPGTKGIILKLKVNQDSTLNITIDDTISQFYDLKAGDLIEWKGLKTFSLDMSNAGGIEGEFNGKPIPAFGASGKPAHVVLSGTTP